MKYLILLHIVFAASYISSYSQDYKIINTKTSQELTINDLTNQLSKSKYIIFGEEHNDSIGHYLQLQILEQLMKLTNSKMGISFEMWERDVQTVMDEYLNGWISEKNFKKESRAWSNYDDYKPLIDIAKKQHIPVICANAPARYVNMVTRNGLQILDVLPKSTKRKWLPILPVELDEGRYRQKFDEILGAHAMPGMHLFEAQNVWDATMAHSIFLANKQYKDRIWLHFNGRFHSDEYLGVAKRLEQLSKKNQIVTISCFQGTNYEPEIMRQLADYVIITSKK